MPPATIFCNRCGFASAEDARFCQRCGATFSTAASSAPFVSPPVAAPVAVALSHYAGFWIRVVAAFLDTLLLFSAAFPVRMLLGSAITLIAMDSHFPTYEMLHVRRLARIAMGIAMGWAYKAGFESSLYKVTLGKLAVGVRVTDLEGRRLSLMHATARYFSKIISIMTAGIGYVMAGFDSRKQALHDRIAGTLVTYRCD